MSEVANAELWLYFPTPFMRHVWSDGGPLNTELRAAILAQERANPGRDRTNVGGWHSQVGGLEFCGEAGKKLVEHMVEMTNVATHKLMEGFGQRPPSFSWTIQAWANVNRAGDFNRTHTHPGSTWSGTYYVDPGDPPEGSESGTPLNLMDPCQGRANTFFPILVPSVAYVRPEPGLMVLFPSYVPHMVYAHRGSRPRISIAFNMRKEPFP
jgi:uncharacterized protein (TIGR02466 family)